MLETVPEESSRTGSADEGAITPPPYTFYHEESPHNTETIPTLFINGSPISLERDSIHLKDDEPRPSNFEEMANIFHEKQKAGNIDVWWLYDDGGKILK